MKSALVSLTKSMGPHCVQTGIPDERRGLAIATGNAIAALLSGKDRYRLGGTAAISGGDFIR